MRPWKPSTAGTALAAPVPEGDADGSIGSSCGSGMVYDCSMTCVTEPTAAAYTGDGVCDDGTYGYVLTFAEFDYDGGDCG